MVAIHEKEEDPMSRRTPALLAAISLLAFTLFQAMPAGAAEVWTEVYDSGSATLHGGGHLMTMPTKLHRFPKNAWIVEAEWLPVNMPTYAVHHALLLGYRKALDPLLCMPEGLESLSVLFPMGRERSRIQLGYDRKLFLSADPVGIYVDGEVFAVGMGIMLDNPDPWPYPDVKMQIKLTYFRPGEGEKEPVKLENMLLNLGGGPWVDNLPTTSQHPLGICNTDEFLGVLNYLKEPDPAAVNRAIDDGIEFAVPPKSDEYVVRWSEELEVAHPMAIRYIWPHVHSYTNYIALLVNGRKVWQAPIVKSPDDAIIEIPTDHLDIRLKPGDKLNVEASYRNPYDRPYPQMGLLYLYYSSEAETVPVKVDVSKLRWVEEAREMYKATTPFIELVNRAPDLSVLEEQMRQAHQPYMEKYLAGDGAPHHHHGHHGDDRQSWKKGW